MGVIYLDYAAATPVDDDVFAAMKPYFTDEYYNPSALYRGGLSARDALEKARSSVSKSIGARPSEIIFTAGGTESANLAIKGVMEQNPGANMVLSAVEHDAVRNPAKNYKHKDCPVDNLGVVDVKRLESLIDDKTALVSIMYANNEIGTVQPIKEVVNIVKNERSRRKKSGNKTPIYVHTDACQAPNYLDIYVGKLGVDLMTLNGGKIYGPKQSGVLYARTGVVVKSQIEGGGQEFNIRSGTENVAFAVGFAKALEKVTAHPQKTAKNMKGLQKYFIKKLQTELDAEINGHKKMRLPNNIHATFIGADNERMLFYLDDHDVWATSGSACSASNEEVSHVLSAIGLPEDKSRASLRFSMGRPTTVKEIDKTIEILKKAVLA